MTGPMRRHPAARFHTRIFGVALLITYSGILAAAHPVRAAGHIAVVRFIDHGLTVQPPQQDARKGWVHQSLFPADRLLTQAHQRAKLQFVDASVLYMNQRTDLVLRGAGFTQLKHGEIDAVDAGAAHRKVRTDAAVATANGTMFDVRIETGSSTSSGYGTPTPNPLPPGTTTVSVVKGVVVVSGHGGYGYSLGRVTVHAGQWTHAVPGRAPTTPTSHNASQDTAWKGGMP